MPPTKATTTYKKKDGILAVQNDRKYVHWTPATPPGSSPSVTIPVVDITNLQQTPATAKSIALKIFVKDENYVFTFTDKDNGRREQESLTQILRDTISANKAKDSQLPTVKSGDASGSGTPAQGDVEGQSAAMAIAKAVSSKAEDDGWYDDTKLKSDIQLQQSLFKADLALHARFTQALKDKPDSVSMSQFTSQFWSTRLHLLRAHAIENAQKQGEYNVLPTIGFTHTVPRNPDEEPVKMLNINKEQIKLIFKQYPVVREAYQDECPPMKPNEFWTRFFRSRLLKKLKGERISQHDERDSALDKYLDRPEGGSAARDFHVPHWMDLEGNEQNHSQRKGNRPDEDMRPSGNDKAPILRILNSLSEKMMAHIEPEDSEAHAPIGMDEETFEQVRLRDLANDDVDNRVILNIREQQRYAGGGQDGLSAEAKLYAQQDPSKVLATLNRDLQPSKLGADERGTLRLDRVIGYQSDDDSDDSDEDEATSAQTNGTTAKSKKRVVAVRIGSHTAMASASISILSSIKQRRHAASSDSTSLNGLSQTTFDQLTMTHNTTTEFLHYYWQLFLSGDASRTNELAQLVSTLERSMDRINSVAETAEAEREKFIRDTKDADQKYYEQFRKRRRRDWNSVKGGKAAVEAMIKPTVQAIAKATEAFKRAFEEQTREAAGTAAPDAAGSSSGNAIAV